MDFINRNARCLLAWSWFYFLSVLSFSPTYKVNVHPPTSILQLSRLQFSRCSNGGLDKRFELSTSTRHDKHRLSKKIQAIKVNTRHVSIRTYVSPLCSRPSTNSPQAENKGGIIRSIKNLIFWPLRFLFLKPLRYLVELFIDGIDLDDGTATETQPLEGATVEPFVILRAENSRNPISVAIEEGVSGAPERSTATIRLAPPPQHAVKPKTTSNCSKPVGTRWAIASPGFDLSGEWDLIVSDEFKQDYDRYLTELGQPVLVRSLALGIISRTTEVTKQTDQGKSLLIRGQNVRGTWDRTLVASGTEIGKDEYSPLIVPVMSADSEKVEAESWWEADGHVHVSWLRGVRKYGGGAFESRRYLDGETYVCESTFHSDDNSKQPNRIVWRFQSQSFK